ncbi:Integrin-alpha FG-GAP repeat-containing protein 2-like protein [Aix galericulata]|nr:Integrin-alpha FG-GAP repeat-containing protein 2-like protein [Aix galericulata]
MRVVLSVAQWPQRGWPRGLRLQGCLSLSLSSEGDRDAACVRCGRVEELSSLVAELKEEVRRLRDKGV